MSSLQFARSLTLAGALALLALPACSGASMERVDPSADDEVGCRGCPPSPLSPEATAGIPVGGPGSCTS